MTSQKKLNIKASIRLQLVFTVAGTVAKGQLAGSVDSSAQHHHREEESHSKKTTLTLIPVGNLESPEPGCISLDCGRKLEYSIWKEPMQTQGDLKQANKSFVIYKFRNHKHLSSSSPGHAAWVCLIILVGWYYCYFCFIFPLPTSSGCQPGSAGWFLPLLIFTACFYIIYSCTVPHLCNLCFEFKRIIVFVIVSVNLSPWYQIPPTHFKPFKMALHVYYLLFVKS